MTDALTFSAFLGAYGFQRFVHADAWPIADEVFNHFPFIHGEYPMFFVASFFSSWSIRGLSQSRVKWPYSPQFQQGVPNTSAGGL